MIIGLLLHVMSMMYFILMMHKHNYKKLYEFASPFTYIFKN